MYEPGDVILTQVQFSDSLSIKKRPALVLFEEFGNLVVAGITSNTNMKGIQLKVSDGILKDSVLKLNYIFTISPIFVDKKLFSLNKKKRQEVHTELTKKLSALTK